MLTDTVLDDVRETRNVVGVQRENSHRLRVERFANLVADEIEDRLDVELRRQPGLHAVDDAELVRPLLEQRVGGRQLERALRDFPFEVHRPLRVVECDCRLAREQAQHVAIGVVEAAVETVHVDVQVTEQTSLNNQRRHDARTLPLARRRDRRVHEFGCARTGGTRQV